MFDLVDGAFCRASDRFNLPGYPNEQYRKDNSKQQKYCQNYR
jgi:hypothetical protein